MASVDQKFKYDVFLSFNGVDTRDGFTRNLKKALDHKGIRTFTDDEELKKGDEITPSLSKEIEDSMMAIVVLSENYASSSFCLQELSMILDTMKDKAGRYVLPVFYKVDPSDVRELKRSYGEAMAEHDKASFSSIDINNKWKASLHQVASLSGHHYKGDVYEHEFIEKIVEQLSRNIFPVYLPVDQKFKYDVFLSFRGEDTRYRFTGHLKNALDDKGVRTFMDDKELQKGEEITQSHLRAIEESQIAIVVLSKNYASSSFCLQELSKILDTMENKVGCFVLPVFYKVDPSDVRHLSRTFGEAMDKHKANSNLDKWKVCLHQVANFVGFHYKKKGDVYEHEFIGMIVEQVLKKIKPGLEQQKQHVISLLNVGSDDEINMVGIHGIDGIGITTLSLSVYNLIADQFEGSCFLEKVGENSHVNGLIYLQKILLSHIVGINIEITSVRQGVSILQRTLKQKKILLILDDVDKEEQLEAIAGRSDWFGLGSRIIITTQDKRLLTCHGVQHTYEVKGLDENDAFELVRWKAFKDEFSLSYNDVHMVGFHGITTLALDFPIKEFQNVRVLNFDHCELLTKIPDMSGLPNLEEISIQNCEELTTIDESIGFLDKLKILRFIHCTKIHSVPPLSLASLEELNFSHCYSLESLPPNGFVGELKILRVISCTRIRMIPFLMSASLEELDISDCTSLESFSYVVDGLGDKLKTISVRGCINLRTIPPLKLDLLETFDLSHCYSLEHFPLVADGFLGKLKTLLVEKCHNLRSIPPLKLDSLETLDLSYCDSLESFPLVVDSFLGKLKTLLVEKCHNLRSIPPLKLDSLETLDLSYCDSLESFPLVVDAFLGKLKTLRVKSCRNLRSIPPLKLDSLETLDLSCCYRLESFPHVVDGFLGKLKTLLAKSCCNLRKIPPLKLDSLEKLDLSNCYRLESFPLVVDGLLDKLKFLSIKRCVMLRSIPHLSLTSLELFDLSYCPSLESFPEILGKMKNQTNLYVDNTPIKEFPFPCTCGIVDLPNRVDALSKLTIQDEQRVNPMQYSHVEYICLRDCKLSDEYLSMAVMLFANVNELHLTKNSFTVLPKSIENCHFLWMLVLDDCEELQEIKGIPPCLKTLSALNCKSLTSSCKNKLLNQELHEAGNTWFRLPQAKIPKWFHHQCEAGLSISFWFRNKFPAIALCFVSPLTWDGSQHCVRVIINGYTFFYKHGSKVDTKSLPNTYHLHLFHMQMENFNDDVDIALLENKWNHAEVDFGFPVMYSGVHVLKEKSSMKDIQFTNPENDANIVLHSGC